MESEFIEYDIKDSSMIQAQKVVIKKNRKKKAKALFYNLHAMDKKIFLRIMRATRPKKHARY